MLESSNATQIENEWKEYYPKVYAYFYKRVENRFEVEELTSLTMNTTFIARHKLKKVQHFHGYLWKVAHNYLVSYIKRKNLEPLSLSLDLSEFVETSDNSWVPDPSYENLRSQNYSQKLAQLKQCIQNCLNESEKKLIDLTIYQELTSRQVGQAMGLAPEAVRKRLQRTISKLKVHCLQLWQSLTEETNSQTKIKETNQTFSEKNTPNPLPAPKSIFNPNSLI
jgi:RNA polymerase sigma-70 factor (ECF subfamily)